MNAGVNDKGLRIYIEIPIKDVNRHFVIYKPYSLPYLEPSVNKFISFDIPNAYLAVSGKNQIYTVMTEKDLQTCQEGYYTFCPAKLPFYSRNFKNCLVSLYTGNAENIKKLCTKVVESGEFDPIWISVPYSMAWIYSLSQETKVERHCKVERGVETSPAQADEELWLNGTGILYNAPGCSLIGADFRILSSIKGQTLFHLYQHRHIDIPDLRPLVNHEEQHLFRGLDGLELDHLEGSALEQPRHTFNSLQSILSNRLQFRNLWIMTISLSIVTCLCFLSTLYLLFKNSIFHAIFFPGISKAKPPSIRRLGEDAVQSEDAASFPVEEEVIMVEEEKREMKVMENSKNTVLFTTY